MSLKFTLLTVEEATEGPNQLQVLKEGSYGVYATLTDLSVLQGATVYEGLKTDGGELMAENPIWTKTPNGKGRAMCTIGHDTKAYHPGWDAMVRPVLSPSETEKIKPDLTPDLSSRMLAILLGSSQKYRSCNYGEYPQTIADAETSAELEKLYRAQSLQTTGKNYNLPNFRGTDSRDSYDVSSYAEYEYKSKKYIRIPGEEGGREKLLASGKRAKTQKPQWIEVQPVEWLMDPNGTWVSKKCLFFVNMGYKGGYDGNYYGNFEKTLMGQFLDTYFAKDIEPSQTGLKKILTLEEKSVELDKASHKEREAREKAVKDGVESGKKLSEIDVQGLRDAEGKARGKRLAEILKNKYKNKYQDKSK